LDQQQLVQSLNDPNSIRFSIPVSGSRETYDLWRKWQMGSCISNVTLYLCYYEQSKVNSGYYHLETMLKQQGENMVLYRSPDFEEGIKAWVASRGRR
jgi:hypothetical protein